MSGLSYRDHCIITRPTGEADRFDNLVSEEIYNGRCDFQPGRQTDLPIITHNDVVLLPKHVMVLENDSIEVKTQFGRIRKGIVKLANDLGLDMTGDCITEIEIKQSTEKR